MPVDETRYLAVAWEMWQRGDFLVPFRNGAAYSHKPPLLFWLFHLGWAVFGVNDIWPRLLSPLLALATLGVTARIAATLWPDAPWRAERSAWILLGCVVFAVFAGMAMFDMLLALCVSNMTIPAKTVKTKQPSRIHADRSARQGASGQSADAMRVVTPSVARASSGGMSLGQRSLTPKTAHPAWNSQNRSGGL